MSKSCVRKLCVSKLCVDKVNVSKLCGDKLCVKSVCVWRSCDGEGRKNKGGGERGSRSKNSCVGKVVCMSACLPVCMCIINTTLMKTSLACLPISAARRDLRIFPRWNLLDGIQF